jgi:predicted Fe-Mo cluster-binding NifX family protein
MKVAIPSINPGGLEAQISPHFGHCDVFTLVDVDNGTVGEISTVPSVPHEQGGCMAPVNFLASHGVNILIAGGMGMRPLMGFNQVGIDVYHNGGLALVDQVVSAFAEGRLQKFGQEHTCGGGRF